MAGVNSVSVTDMLIDKYGLKIGNKEQMLKEGIHVYPDGVLCNPSADSKSIHLFTGTWMNGKHSFKHKIVTDLKRHINTPKGAGLYAKWIDETRGITKINRTNFKGLFSSSLFAYGEN